MYVDSAYIVKAYVNEADSPAVREALRRSQVRITSAWALAEVSCAIHRHIREGALTSAQAQEITAAFLEHIERGIWTMVPVGDAILRGIAQLVANMPAGLFLRAGDAAHLITARQAGETEVWTSDRHMTAAAPYFGLVARSV